MAWYRIENQGASAQVQTKEITASTSTQNVFPDDGYALSLVTVNPQKHTQTAQVSQRTVQYDLGEVHNTRYINTSNVPNNNTGTAILTERRSSVDLGANNSFRYVDTTKIPTGNAYEDVLYTNSSPTTAFTGGVLKRWSSQPPIPEGAKRYLEVTYAMDTDNPTVQFTVLFDFNAVFGTPSSSSSPMGAISMYYPDKLVYRKVYVQINSSTTLIELVVSSIINGYNTMLIPISIKLVDRF